VPVDNEEDIPPSPNRLNYKGMKKPDLNPETSPIKSSSYLNQDL